MKNLTVLLASLFIAVPSFAGVMTDGEYWGVDGKGRQCLLIVRPPTKAHSEDLPREENLRFVGIAGVDINGGDSVIMDQIVINPVGRLVQASMICEDPFEPVDVRAGMTGSVFNYYCLATALGAKRVTALKIMTKNAVPTSYEYAVQLGRETLNLSCSNLKKKFETL